MAKINWTDQANSDIDAIIDFLAPQSEVYTKVQISRIFQKVDLLEDMPQIGRIVPELEYPNVR